MILDILINKDDLQSFPNTIQSIINRINTNYGDYWNDIPMEIIDDIFSKITQSSEGNFFMISPNSKNMCEGIDIKSKIEIEWGIDAGGDKQIFTHHTFVSDDYQKILDTINLN